MCLGYTSKSIGAEKVAKTDSHFQRHHKKISTLTKDTTFKPEYLALQLPHASTNSCVSNTSL